MLTHPLFFVYILSSVKKESPFSSEKEMLDFASFPRAAYALGRNPSVLFVSLAYLATFDCQNIPLRSEYSLPIVV